MWQKVDPRGFRTGIVRWWISEYYAPTKKISSEYMVQDLKVRRFVDKFYAYSWIAKVVFRKGNDGSKTKNDLLLFTAKPWLVLWKNWDKMELFKKQLRKNFWEDFDVVVKEVSKPELYAKIMAEHISSQLERRMPYRRVIKSVIEKTIAKWWKWIKISIAGRLNGAEMARSETFKEGRIPLQTLRADVDYHYMACITKYWVLWVKVWIYKWDIDDNNKKSVAKKKTVRRNTVTKK